MDMSFQDAVDLYRMIVRRFEKIKEKASTTTPIEDSFEMELLDCQLQK